MYSLHGCTEAKFLLRGLYKCDVPDELKISHLKRHILPGYLLLIYFPYIARYFTPDTQQVFFLAAGTASLSQQRGFGPWVVLGLT